MKINVTFPRLFACMMRCCLLLILNLFLLEGTALAQGHAVIQGKVEDNKGRPVELASVSISGTTLGTNTLPDGTFRLEVPAGQKITLVISNLSAEPFKQTLTLNNGEQREILIRLRGRSVIFGDFIRRRTRIVNEPGSVYFMKPGESNMMPSTTGDGISSMIKSIVGTHNDLTSQYAVRGGNYDENLVYVNDFEIYRPFLVRSGQQEGLSFVNSDLVDGVNFSLGGFQAKYGDKMSSVLDVTYRHPEYFKGTASISLLGASLSLEGASRNEKFTYLIGLRQKSNQYLLQSQPTKGVYNPSFTDAQALLTYDFNQKWQLEGIINYARNRFNFIPEESVSSFGLLTQAYQLDVFYNGREQDQFDSRFGGLSLTNRPNDHLRLKFLASRFQTNESETYDISGEYLLGELETDLGKQNFGQIKDYLGTGIIQSFARNYLKVNVGTLAHRGWYDKGKSTLLWGLDATSISINDKLHEWERRDSAGFTQPYQPYDLQMMHYYDTKAEFQYMRYSGFLQDNLRFGSDSASVVFLSAGVRFNYSSLNNEFIISPRIQATFRPVWKKELLLKAAIGMYAQPPLYREMRDLNGNVNTDIKAQKSLHIVLGAERNFSWNNRPFKLTGELYYKRLTDLVPYEYDNVRIRYLGKNNATGYAYGGEVRLYGDLLRDATSWISVGVLKTAEDLNDDHIVYENTAGQDSAIVDPGFIPRPSDQRAMVGIYFQDYLPRNHNFRLHLNLMYATGLPFGPPNGERYADTLRLPDYKRVDVGFSALLLDSKRKDRPAYSFFNHLESVWLSLEVFNLLGIQNTLSYTWIQDQTSGKTFAVPNRLTSRLLNVKLIVKF